MNHEPQRRATDHTLARRVLHIIECGDISLSCVLLGLGLIAWGVLGLVIHPADLTKFASDFLLDYPIFWGLNSIVFGLSVMWVAVENFPTPVSLLVGTYGCVIYTWIAMSRPVASVSSGVTLNFIVIVVSVLLIHRSGRKPGNCKKC